MARMKASLRVPLAVEVLEPREAPSATPWLLEAFDDTTAGSLPGGWAQWSSSGASSFNVSAAQSYSGSQSLLNESSVSSLSARGWFLDATSADVGVSARVWVDSLVPLHLFARGSNLDSATPSYYALSITRGLQAQLLKVENGTTTVLANLRSGIWVSGKWIQASLDITGSNLRARIMRLDTGSYLNSLGQWQAAPAWALDRTDASIAAAGRVGVARPPGYAGNVWVDDFAIYQEYPPPYQNGFETTVLGTLPAGWSQWSSAGPGSFAVSNARAESGTNSLASSGSSGLAARAWRDPLAPDDVQVAADIFLNSLIPAQVFARGRDLDTSSPDYYALSVTRGLKLQIVRVVNGVTSVLGTLNSTTWFSGQWVRATLRVQGNVIRAMLYRLDTGKYLNSAGQWQAGAAWALQRSNWALIGPGQAGFARPASYAGAIYFDDFAISRLLPDTAVPRPSIPRHYSHIRIAQLAYSGSALGTFEDNLLKRSVDLVVPNPKQLAHINAVAPNTPQLLYTNTSNLYLHLLADWLAYADREGIPREAAFYHVAQELPYAERTSPSSRPVSWFWGVYRGGATADFIDLTVNARSPGQSLAFGGAGESFYLGYPERFREINLTLSSGASAGWSAVLEYPVAVDDFGQPTAWASLRTLSDTTGGLTHSGTILFDPPAIWQPALVEGEYPLYYVRFRMISNGIAPVASLILGRDYVNANGTLSGVIPAFDTVADQNGDGYLTDGEYARRSAGKEARFLYESRLSYNGYGEMRPATNPASVGLQDWAIDYHLRLLAEQPLADGLFMDNSSGFAPGGKTPLLEPSGNYATDYGAMVNALSRAIVPRWILVNTEYSATSDPVVQQNPHYFHEFSIRPLAHNYQVFETISGMITRRGTLANPAPYAVIDSHPQNGSPTDPRMQIATLAYYYLIGDPNSTFLMFYGGYEPSTSWTRHWSPAAAYNIGQPQGRWSLFKTGLDPSNSNFTYRIYQRSYGNALVLYKPLSVNRQGVSGTIANNTTTYHSLGGTYRPLRSDGTLGAAITSISLRNGEGAILIKV